MAPVPALVALYQGACYWCLSSHCLLVQCRIRDTMSQKGYDPPNLLQCNYKTYGRHCCESTFPNATTQPRTPFVPAFSTARWKMGQPSTPLINGGLSPCTPFVPAFSAVRPGLLHCPFSRSAFSTARLSRSALALYAVCPGLLRRSSRPWPHGATVNDLLEACQKYLLVPKLRADRNTPKQGPPRDKSWVGCFPLW